MRNCVKESKRNVPLTFPAETWLSCIRSTSTPNFRACLPRVRTASSPPWNEFQKRDLLDDRSPCAVGAPPKSVTPGRSEEHTSELQSPCNLVCRLLLEKKNNIVEQHVLNHSI